MKDVRPCPYCGSEVEVVRVKNDPKTGERRFRIECRHCRALVANGTGFPNETLKESEERIQQYDNVIAERMAPLAMQRIPQSKNAQLRDKKGYERSTY